MCTLCAAVNLVQVDRINQGSRVRMCFGVTNPQICLICARIVGRRLSKIFQMLEAKSFLRPSGKFWRPADDFFAFDAFFRESPKVFLFGPPNVQIMIVKNWSFPLNNINFRERLRKFMKSCGNSSGFSGRWLSKQYIIIDVEGCPLLGHFRDNV